MNELSIMSQCFAQVRRVAKRSPMYIEKFKDIPVDTMMTKDQFETLPFTTNRTSGTHIRWVCSVSPTNRS
jgi:phenylacetate-CoA ligase